MHALKSGLPIKLPVSIQTDRQTDRVVVYVTRAGWFDGFDSFI